MFRRGTHSKRWDTHSHADRQYWSIADGNQICTDSSFNGAAERGELSVRSLAECTRGYPGLHESIVPDKGLPR